MFKQFELKGYNTLKEDLEKVLIGEDGDCSGIDDITTKEGVDYRMYRYKDGRILIPRFNYEQNNCRCLVDKTSKEPYHLLKRFWTAMAVWYESIENEIKRNPKDFSEKVRKRYAKQSELKKALLNGFEKANWIIPYYICWKPKRGSEEAYMYAALPNGEDEPIHVNLSEKMMREIEHVLNEKGVDTQKAHMHIVELRETSPKTTLTHVKKECCIDCGEENESLLEAVVGYKEDEKVCTSCLETGTKYGACEACGRNFLSDDLDYDSSVVVLCKDCIRE